MEIIVSPRGTLSYDGTTVRCAIGRGGVRHDKSEGDGATPVGYYPLRRVLYRADRISAPDTDLPTSAIKRSDGWCDAPEDIRYNQPVRLPYPASAETLWRDDGLYDLVVVLGHNDDPPVPGAGSAIFWHVARPDFGPTEGCVAVSLPDLLDALKHCRAGDLLCVTALDAGRK